MQKRSSIKKPELTESRLTKRLIEELTSKEHDPQEQVLSSQVRHLIAVALGRQGGLKGGKSRAQKLSPKKRKEIAKKGAAARWAKRPSK